MPAQMRIISRIPPGVGQALLLALGQERIPQPILNAARAAAGRQLLPPFSKDQDVRCAPSTALSRGCHRRCRTAPDANTISGHLRALACEKANSADRLRPRG